MPAIDPSAVYVSSPNTNTGMSRTSFNNQINMGSHVSVLSAAPYDAQKNVSVFFYAEDLFELLGQARASTPLAYVKGLIFHYAKQGSGTGELRLVARRADTTGSTLLAWKDKNRLSYPLTSTAGSDISAKDWCIMLQAFYNDTFALVTAKANDSAVGGKYAQKFEGAELYELLTDSTTIPSGVPSEVTFHFMFTQAGNTNWYLNLGSAIPGGTDSRFAFAGVECPPDCYPGTRSDAVMQMNCSIL